MRRVSIVTISTLAALATGIVACSSDSSSSGSGGTTGTGGAAGSASGGVAGSSSGGAAGSATGGTAGSTGGAAGSATGGAGGTAGAATGGTGGGAGACTNAADQAILDDPSLMAEEKISQCGNDNLAQEPGTSNCIKQQTGLSDPCVGCFAGTIQCAATNCWLQCIGGSTAPACTACLAQFCNTPFEACSGLSAT
jgi:hypothetical protein